MGYSACGSPSRYRLGCLSAQSVVTFSTKMVKMGSSHVRLRSLCAALTCVLLLVCGCRGGPDPAVAAEVNGYKITFAELERYLQTQVPDVTDPASQDQSQMLRLTVLRELIDPHVILQRAEKLGLMAVDSEVQAMLDGQRAPFDDPEDFEKQLEERGLTLAEYQAELRRTITIDKLFNKEITSKMSVSQAEIRKYMTRTSQFSPAGTANSFSADPGHGHAGSPGTQLQK